MKVPFEIATRPLPALWSLGGTLPWHEADFSERMLREHLSQKHDAASRRFSIIDQHVAWLNSLAPRNARILDLGCGPGLYTERLAHLGHRCRGIDCGPASIRHATAQAAANNLQCEYLEADMRNFTLAIQFDLIFIGFGQLNCFPRPDATTVLRNARNHLVPEGELVLELSSLELVRQIGTMPPAHHSARSGLFSDRPYLCYKDSLWYGREKASVDRYLIIDKKTRAETEYSSTVQGYSDDELAILLQEVGLRERARAPSLSGSDPQEPDGFFALRAGSVEL